jgi:hypothetical protein
MGLRRGAPPGLEHEAQPDVDAQPRISNVRTRAERDDVALTIAHANLIRT